MKDFLKKYNPKHYKYYLPVIDKKIGEHTDLNKFIKSLSTKDVLILLKSIALANQEPIAFFEESCIVTTLTIRLFCLELDISDVELKNAEILKLIQRLDQALKLELAYRKEKIKETPKFSIIRDIKEN